MNTNKIFTYNHHIPRLFAEQHGLTVQDCLEHAYNDIKDRKGTMVDGVFIKEENK